MKRFLLLAIFSISLFLGACQAKVEQTTTPAKPVVFVSILPQKYFVERIAGDSVTVKVMVEPGAEPHTYEPKPAQMAALAKADLYFSIGDSFEATWLTRIRETNPDLQIVDTAVGITRRHLDSHQHEQNGTEDSTGDLDPHIWLSPRLVAMQSKIIHDALVTLMPTEKSSYDANLQSFLADIAALDTRLSTGFAQVSGRSFMVYHPSWGYFADDYGLEQIAVEIGGTEPSASELADIINQAQTLNIHIIFAQPEFNSRFAETIAEQIHGEVLLISSLEENWLENMRKVGDALLSGLSQE